jgi:hypothetical protein
MLLSLSSSYKTLHHMIILQGFRPRSLSPPEGEEPAILLFSHLRLVMLEILLKIYVGNLTQDTDVEELKTLFGQAGTVVHAEVSSP